MPATRPRLDGFFNARASWPTTTQGGADGSLIDNLKFRVEVRRAKLC
ncbi:MAG: hypothetical protein AAF823_10945 [Planctomycetota bacterium]